jgi:microcystin-dependent protein
MDPFLGEIRIFGGNFAPQGWALCNGQTLAINQYTALFSILGNRYGGNGQTTFCLPNLGGGVPVGMGQGPGLSPRELGETGGSAAVTLAQQEIAPHTHTVSGVGANGTGKSPANASWAQYNSTNRPATHANIYGAAPDVTMSPAALSSAGQSQPHNNMQPWLALNYIICLDGIYPPHQ